MNPDACVRKSTYSHKIIVALLASGGIQACALLGLSTDLNDISFNKEPSSVFLVT